MENRDLNKESVFFGQTHDIAHHAGVIDNIGMREHHAFGKAGGSGGVLHVDDVAGGKLRHTRLQGLHRHRLSFIQKRGKTKHAGGVVAVSDMDNIF